MTTRRSFLGSILAAATPPGFVRAGVLMPVAPLIVTQISGMEILLRQDAALQMLQDAYNEERSAMLWALRTGHVYGGSIARTWRLDRA